MASRQFQQFSYSLEKQPVTLYAVADGGGAGTNMSLLAADKAAALSAAPTNGFRGVKSITRNGDGDYTFNFQDNYFRLLDVTGTALAKDGSTTPLAVAMWLKAVNTGAAGGATVRIVTFLATPGTPVAPGTNDRWFFAFTFSNTTAG